MSDPPQEPDALERKIIRQVEYYFGDINLVRDKFMQQKIVDGEGWIDLSCLITFNRLKALSTDFDVICAAISKSKSQLIESNTEKTKIRRLPTRPLPTFDRDRLDDLRDRSVYVKGFPLEASMDDIIDWVDGHAQFDSVQMRKNKTERTFKGSVFIILSTKKEAAEFLAKPDLKYKPDDSEPLVRLTKGAWFKQMTEKRKLAKIERTKAAKAKEDEKQTKENVEVMEKLKKKMPKAAILHIEGLHPQIRYQEIKETFSKFGNLVFVDFTTGDSDAYLRFAEEGGAEQAWEKAKEDAGDKGVFVKECEVHGDVLDGEAEEKHWDKVLKSRLDKHNEIQATRKRGGGGGGWGGRGGRGGRGGGRGRGRGGFDRRGGGGGGQKRPADKVSGAADADCGEPKAKVAATSSE